MQRRTLIRVGIASAAVLAAAGGTLSLLRPAWQAGQFSPRARGVMRAIGQAVLEGLLPPAAAAQEASLNAWLSRLEATVGALPAATRSELSQLLVLLTLTSGRRWLAGLEPDWPVATPAEVRDALQSMRTASAALRQQAYHALRDMSMAAFAAGRDSWPRLGYPGPTDL